MNKTPFHKILIANRGEIALRLIRSARAAGYRTVAVYSAADEEAPHVVAADEAVPIGAAQPGESYLRIDRIMEAVRVSGADALHPGYGFLAENAELARACREAKVRFIGPSEQAINAMGDKARAKTIMDEAGVPCVPGYQSGGQNEQQLLAEAERIGFPLMIKASAGGGGRGMRLVEKAEAFPDALRSARSEAETAFGNPQVILERAIINPRHVEIQVLADRDGNVIHLGERDCSIQRRHQKLIEEAPSPAVTRELREAMGKTAIRAAEAIDYEGAGTLEFLLDEGGNYYFMEMNTRLQVEHPVTELVTGLDIVDLQLRIASGEALPLAQEDVVLRGHAVEARLCAEDPLQSFMPQSGVISTWRIPENVRVDHGLADGSVVSPYYDSMVAKIISFGQSRDEACRKLATALEDTVVLGVTTNRTFLASCVRHSAFARGEATTNFIESYYDELTQPDAVLQQQTDVVSAALLCLIDGSSSGTNLAHGLPILVRFERGEGTCSAQVTDRGRGYLTVSVEEDTTEFRVLRQGKETVRFERDGIVEQVTVHCSDDGLAMHYRGHSFDIRDCTHASVKADQGSDDDGKIRASMTGRVVEVSVVEGDTVDAGQPVLTLEAMKMENVHVTPIGGRVGKLHTSKGDQVTMSALLAEIEQEERIDVQET